MKARFSVERAVLDSPLLYKNSKNNRQKKQRPEERRIFGT